MQTENYNHDRLTTRGRLMSGRRQAEHGRRCRVSSSGIHASGGGDVVWQEGGRHCRLRIEVGHPAGGHGHMVVVEAMLRWEACGRLQLVPLVMRLVDVWRDRRDGGRR